MTNSMKSENKLDGASNFRAWKTRIDLILAKNKVLDIVKGKIVKPEFKKKGRREGTAKRCSYGEVQRRCVKFTCSSESHSPGG
jgi:hypothetical protein